MNQPPRVAMLAGWLVATGCASRGATPPTTGTAPTANVPAAAMHEHGPMLAATAGPGFTVADVRFMQGMIGHHEQAIVMAAMVPTHGAGEDLRKLGQKIDISQRDEIAFMKRWLGERDQGVPAEGEMGAMPMPGMLTPAQLARLGAARGPEFERLFLLFMIQHHRGALEMVDTLFHSPGAGQDSEIFRFATDVGTDQRDEIYVMQTMLAMLDTAQGDRTR